jgi:hypothetical protein
MVNFASVVSAVVGLAAIASAAPSSLEKRTVNCRDDLGSTSFGRVSSTRPKQASRSRKH